MLIMNSGNIKPINRSSVHKICSGQVVLTLATAIKELVENSIDADATIIEVKLKEYGSESVEVIDNGKGVKASDFQGITLKHHTSKISDFSDVPFVSTFGFRGEALSSLCALSNVEITTCHSDSPVGTHLIYDHDGVLIKNSPTHRQIGTTIILRNLFCTLPVRHKEFLRNVRREYAKMIQLLTAYCLISVNKRITCSNTTEKGKKTIVLSTNCSDSYKENIGCIFGNKQVNNLMEFVQHSPSESVLDEYFLPKSDHEKCKMFKIEGYISNSTHGEGRSSTDRQFLFINGRPCDLPKVSKLINEVYHSFNKAQYPFVFLNIILTEGSADVNVTPDKRQIFIPEEKLLLSIIKTSLCQLYDVQPSQLKVSMPSLFFQKNNEDLNPADTESPNASKNLEEFSLKRKVDSMIEKCNENPLSPSLKSFRNDNLKREKADTPKNHWDDIEISPDYKSFPSIKTECMSSSSLINKDKIRSPKKIKTEQKTSINGVNFTLTLPFKEEKMLKGSTFNLKEVLQKAYRGGSSINSDLPKRLGNKVQKQKNTSEEKIVNFLSKQVYEKYSTSEMDHSFEGLSNTNICSSVSSLKVKEHEEINANEESNVILDEPLIRRKKCKIITFDLHAIKENLNARAKTHIEETLAYRKFRSKIAPTENVSAEEELKKEIKKENFSQMDIIGQFNLGFIITRLKDDLFIIDQHATDEKYNFETLRKETVLETQKLLNPQSLNLTAVSEATLLDNLHIFEKSGFKFNINEDNSVGNKVQLISVPVSQNWRFGKEDVDEMIFMLTDNPVSMVRPSRVNQMFASRACRKSVMIGTALKTSMMRKLVLRMGEIEQPWNCPHGRPTMRHLFNLNLLKPD